MSLPAEKKRKRTALSPGEPPTGSAKVLSNVPGLSQPGLQPNSSSRLSQSNKPFHNFIPRDVNVIAFAEKRSREIRTLLDAMSAKKTNKRIFQQLPRHMRRRAMSYNVKRLPKRLRAVAEQEISRAKKPKRLRNKYRKRGRNKKLLYERRQKSKCWLETHVWHAKRFHMVEKWGYKLPAHPNDKGFRAAFRASSEHCIMTDMSYLECWQFQGPQATLLEGIQKFTSLEVGRTFAYKDYLDGHLEGSCLLYEPAKYPSDAMGVVRFIWMQSPQTNGPSTHRTLHLWTHPSMSAKFLTQVLLVFNMHSVEEEKTAPEDNPHSDTTPMEVEKTNDAASPRDGIEGKVGFSEDFFEIERPFEYRSSSCCLRILKKNLNRFRLTGPESTAVLKSVLKQAALPADLPKDKDFWWKMCCGDETVSGILERQQAAWSGVEYLPMSTDIRSGAVLGIVVRDPRIFLPRRKASLNNAKTAASPILLPGPVSRLPDRSGLFAFSPIWEEDVRARVKEDKLSDHAMNKLRSGLPAPGLQLDLGLDEARIPVVLIRNGGYNQQENHSKSEYGAGWDLIVPAGWGMSFWIPLVYNGARVGGLQELGTVARHRTTLVYPVDFPDTAAGKISAIERRGELEAKFQRYPPDKRPNYLKMGTLTAFYSPWQTLIQDWCDIAKYADISRQLPSEASSTGFHVVRNLRLLSLVQSVLSGDMSTETFLVDHAEFIGIHARGLVAVHLLFRSGGTSQDFSMLCLPSSEDYRSLAVDRNFKGPVEPPHKDPFRKTEPPKLRRKLQLQEILADKDSVVDHCARQLLGFVIKGGYSFIRGSEIAMGFCTLSGLLQLARLMPKRGKKEMLAVLARHPHSLQYHFVEMTLLPSSLCL